MRRLGVLNFNASGRSPIEFLTNGWAFLYLFYRSFLFNRTPLLIIYCSLEVTTLVNKTANSKKEQIIMNLSENAMP